MIGSVLSLAGIHLGNSIDDIVFEDQEFGNAFDRYDVESLRSQIKIRNSIHETWGLKRPNLHLHGPDVIRFFRKPILITIIRDPIAVTSRVSLSESVSEENIIVDTAFNIFKSLEFARTASCPTLMISYEKAVSDPLELVEHLSDFCSLKPDKDVRDNMVAAVVRDRPDYIRHARRVFDGYIDRMDGGNLIGWARQIDSHIPLELDIYLDGSPAVQCYADVYRADLHLAGFGSGHHGFAVDLSFCNITNDTVIDVRVRGLTFSLQKSGHTVEQFRSLT